MTRADEAKSRTLESGDIRARLNFLVALGCGLLESGETSGQTCRTIEASGKELGLDQVSVHSFGLLLRVEAEGAGQQASSATEAANSLDLIDCNRSADLAVLSRSVLADSRRWKTGEEGRDHLATAEQRIRQLRATTTPWWVIGAGLTMLAFFISMQVGVTWMAWASAALIQALVFTLGVGIGRLGFPRLFVVIAQSCMAGAFATLLVQVGFVDPVGSAAAIAVNWLLLLPLPQVIGAVTDAVDADFLSSVTRLGSVAVAALGITVGGVFTFSLGEWLGMDHPTLDALPSFPWYLILVFSALGAISNAFANGGRLALVPWPALLGASAAAVSQLLLHTVGLTPLWATTFAAAGLGVLSALIAGRTDYPMQVLALMGVTGALLPGIPVFFGIIREMGGHSGMQHFGVAVATSLGIGAGVALGAALVRVVQERLLRGPC